MADAIDLLKQLQQLDAELFRLRRQQAETPRELARLDEALAGEQSKVAAAEQRIKTLQLAQKDKEGELQAGEANVRKLQRSEEHTSELQSQSNLVCRLLLYKQLA